MSYRDEMVNRLQKFQRKSEVFAQIFNAYANQFESTDAGIEDLRLQMSIDTATWGLAVYENELEIPVDNSKPLDERRSVIKSKMRGTGQVDAALIKLVADSYTNGDVEVAFDGSINITFTSVIGLPPNIDDAMNAIDEIAPAHLAVLYTYIYNTYQDLSTYTHQQMEVYTYEELRSSELD
ncbi:putative phage tail protein [Tindallia californiensis]|uniref:DUF2313 domain-containing protein n=1 Tax=Tindallia californiensis TaxID=159292 RepID=A0A1H3R1N5_9FIRM|nr:putative phage tail protein [Tindallia californiensis]SDZ19530.1 hypothetical protein SAMN05192546_11186 [Tindallia californiensis]